MTNKFIQFDVESAELMEDDPTSRFAWAKIQAFSSGPNRHDLICDDETLEKTARTIYNTPVMYEVRYGNDFGSHTEPGRSMIAGFVVPNSAEFFRLPDNRLSMSVLARIWKAYAPKVMEIFKRENSKKVSVEMELIKSEPMGNGLTRMVDFVYTGVQLLGDMVTEASPGANAVMLSFSDARKKYEEDLKLETIKYKDINFNIPETVKQNSNIALDLYKDHGKATGVALATAKYFSKNNIITPEKVRNVYKYLDTHKNKPKDNNNPDSAFVSFMMFGGMEAYEWAKSIVEKMEEEDNHVMSYFEKPKKEDKPVEKDEVKKEEMAAEEPVEEKEEKAEDPKEEEKEDSKKEEMSFDENLDMAACLAMLADETEDYAKLVEDHKNGTVDFAKMCYAMYNKMCKMNAEMCKMSEEMTKMSSESEVYMSENKSLKEFKAQTEAREYAFQVEKILNEVSETMPKDKVEEAREDSKNFSIDSIDAFSNKVKAIAFSYVKNGKKVEETTTRIGMPFANRSNETASIWKK